MKQTTEQRIETLRIPPDFSLLQALRKMDELQAKLLLVMEGRRLLGLLSIGDIQRAIIRNVAMEAPIGGILREGVLLAREGDSMDHIRQQMLQLRTEFMPVVNDAGELADVFFWDDLLDKEPPRREAHLGLKVVIMAGGKGTRLKPITNVLPKPLIPVGEKTILEHILDRFVQVGCDHFLMSLNYRAEMIMHYFDNLAHPDYKIEYFREERFSGTAGSLSLLRGRLDETFFVSNCDIIIDADYAAVYEYHREHRNDITLVGVVKHYPIPYGVLQTGADGQLLAIQEKPELTFKINSGMYVLEAAMLDLIPEGQHYHITELIEDVRRQGGRVGVFPVNEGAWMDIGEWSEYNKTVTRLGYSDLMQAHD